MSKDAQSNITNEALLGRLPVLDGERVYKNYFSFLATYASFQFATWAFLVGSFLPWAGTTWAAILVFLAGAIISMAIVALSIGPFIAKFGVYTTDFTKPALGPHASWLTVAIVVVVSLGWAYVVEALTARAVANLWRVLTGAEAPNEVLVTVVAIVLLVVVFFAVIKGPKLFAKLNNIVAPGLVLLSTIFLVVLLVKSGGSIFTTSMPLEETFSGDPWTNYLFAFEFGMAWGFASWAPTGGLSRLVHKPKHIIGPAVIGTGALAGGYLCGIAALGAAGSGGETDPTVWLPAVGGTALGAAFLLFIVLANIPTMSMTIYFTGVSLQHIPIARKRWPVLAAILLAPGLVIAFFTDWLLAHIMSWLTYTAVVVLGLVAVTAVDYFILRRQGIDLRSLFTTSRKGKYYFWGNVNWIGLFSVACGTAFSLWVYNPVTMAVQPIFRYVSSTIPALLISAVLYYGLTRLIAVPLGKGSYTRYRGPAQRSEATQPPVADSEVSL
jgi:NCS1 family nucleobase:cation symporter-1